VLELLDLAMQNQERDLAAQGLVLDRQLLTKKKEEKAKQEQIWQNQG